jgi:ribosomal-protein-alanine N-acetyltransferase
MTDDDLDDVVALEQAVFSDPWQRSFFRADLHRPDGLMLVAEQDGRLLGYAVAWGGEETHIANLAVAPGERRQGIGTRLVGEVTEFARRVGAESLFLEVREGNTGAREFYRRLGFVPTFLRRGYYRDGESAVVMERDLPEAPA